MIFNTFQKELSILRTPQKKYQTVYNNTKLHLDNEIIPS